MLAITDLGYKVNLGTRIFKPKLLPVSSLQAKLPHVKDASSPVKATGSREG